MSRPIVNLDELEFVRWNTRFSDTAAPSDRYGADVADIGRRIGAGTRKERTPASA